jgi:hypothetical protein
LKGKTFLSSEKSGFRKMPGASMKEVMTVMMGRGINLIRGYPRVPKKSDNEVGPGPLKRKVERKKASLDNLAANK